MSKTCKSLVGFFVLCFGLTLANAQAPDDLDSFFRAVTDGRGDRTRSLLASHPDWVNRELFSGIRPLYRAATLGRPEVTQILLENGANVGAKTEHGSLPLHAASQNGHLAVVLLLLASRSDVNASNEYGETALHLAARYKRVKVMTELLRNGAEPDLLDGKGRTALHYAAGLGNSAMVTSLAGAKAKLDLVDSSGFSPLGWALELKRNSYQDVARFLRAQGCKDVHPEPVEP